MSKRRRVFLEIVEMAQYQTTDWLLLCHAKPGEQQSLVSRLAVRAVLRSRGAMLVREEWAMRVRIYDFPNNDLGNEVFRCESDLRDVYDEDGDYYAAMAVLQQDGRYWDGGGAAPLVVLRRVREE